MSFLNRTEGAEDAWEWESEGVPAEAQFPWKSGRAFPGGAGGGRALRRGEKGWNGPADDGLASEKTSQWKSINEAEDHTRLSGHQPPPPRGPSCLKRHGHVKGRPWAGVLTGARTAPVGAKPG